MPISVPLIKSPLLVDATVKYDSDYVEFVIPPILTFNSLVNPYYDEIDLLNEDRAYQRRVTDYFYTQLTEKWLFSSERYNELLKYFKVTVEKDKETVHVEMVSKLSDISDSNIRLEFRKHVLKYIEKYIVTEKFVKHHINRYVMNKGIKWYKLFKKKDELKKYFCKKIHEKIYRYISDIESKRYKK